MGTLWKWICKVGLMPLSSLCCVISRCHFVSNHFPRILDDRNGHHDFCASINIIIPYHTFWLMMGIGCQNLPFLECFDFNWRKLSLRCALIHTFKLWSIILEQFCLLSMVFAICSQNVRLGQVERLGRKDQIGESGLKGRVECMNVSKKTRVGMRV